MFVRPVGGHVVFDWGDSCASHPFASLVVGLRSIAGRFELAERDADLERIRDAYLEPWADYGDRATLLRAVELAGVVGRLSGVLKWIRALGEPGAEDVADFQEFCDALG